MMHPQRYEYVDLAKGICISLVVLFHVFRACMIGRDFENTPYLSFLMNNLIASFRMPFYFFLSGLFYKQYIGKFTFIRKKVNRLLIPFLFFFFVTIICRNFVEYAINPSYSLKTFVFDVIHLKPNTPIWFLLCLFNLNVVFYLIEKYINHDTCFAIIILFLCYGGFFLQKRGINDTIFLLSAFKYSPFFYGGYWVRKKTNWLKKTFHNKDWITMFCMMCVLFLNSYIKEKCILENQIIIIEIIQWLLGGSMGTLSMLLLAKSLNKLPIFSFIGRYSIIVLCTHLIILRLLFQIFIYTPNPPLLGKIIIEWLLVILISYPVIIFCKKYLPHVTAQKDLF